MMSDLPGLIVRKGPMKPPHFEGRLDVEQVGDYWRLLAPVIFYGAFLYVEVPAGIITDFASIPRVLWPVWLPSDPRYAMAAVVHDYLYEAHGAALGTVTRAEADAVLYEAMQLCGAGLSLAWTFWLGVRAGGLWAWDNAAFIHVHRHHIARALVPLGSGVPA